MNSLSDNSPQVLNILDIKDVVSLEIVQHRKVRVIFEEGNAGETIKAHLQCENYTDSSSPCSSLLHNVFHTDSQSFVTLSVRADDQTQRFWYMIGVLALVLCSFLLMWMLRKWLTMKDHRDEVHKDETKEKLTDKTNDENVQVHEDLPRNTASKFISSAILCPVMTLNTRSGEQSTGTACIWYCAVLIVVTSVCVVLFIYSGTRIMSKEECLVLKLSIPKDKHIRHIRSYSEDPSIKDMQFVRNSSSALVTRLQLLDLSPQCRSNLSECRTHALCDSFGSAANVRCRCNNGFYLSNLTCKSCKTSCEVGFFMTRQCGAAGDVVCTPCTQCDGSRYAVAGCTSTQDTICIDVTFPLKQFQSRMASTEDIVHLNVSMSKNVFLEKLKGIKKLEAPLYISSNQQELQFIERRPSGLEIMVKVSDIYLVPEYYDVDHVDDSEFIAKHTQYPQNTKDQLVRIKDNYCRSPLPDEYDLQLEVSKNVSLAATEITCDSSNHNLPACPKGYSDGDKYVYQRLTAPCPKVTTIGTVFENRSNNIICSGNSELLFAIFAQRVEDPTFLTFPSEECKKSGENCSRCLSQKSCMYGSAETNCCNLICHSNKACKSYYSSRCMQSPVECIKGDVTKFSIAPRYPEIQRKFACHMRHRPPSYLYKVTYVASIPKMQFTFEQRSLEMTFKNHSDQLSGMDHVDYLTMYHATDDKYDDEVILVGNFFDHDPINVQQYELHKLQDSQTFKRFRRSDGYESINKLNQRIGIQFAKPFLYTTRTWSDKGCDKNISQILPAQKIYADAMKIVKMPEKKRKGGRFVYQLVSETSQPYIRFFIAENASILSHYKETYKSAKLQPGSLNGNMVWDRDRQVWNVTLSGSISACPGLFTMEVYTENLELQLCVYDMLINCPQNLQISNYSQNFSVGFKIQRKSVEIADIFIFVLNDSVSSYMIVLSSVQGPQFFIENNTEEVSVKTREQSPWISIFAILIILICLSIILAIIYIYLNKHNSDLVPSDIKVPKPDLGPQITLLHDNIDKVRDTKLSTKAKLINVGLIVLYVVYAFLFTFSIFFILFHIVQGPSLSHMTLASNTSLQVRVQMERTLQTIINYEKEESERMIKSVKERLSACSLHFKSNVVENIPDVNLQLQKFLNNMFKTNGIVHDKLVNYLLGQQAVYDKEMLKFVNEFNDTLNSNLHKLQGTYITYLNSVTQNNWLTYPKEIFMTQRALQGRPLSKITDDLVGFLTWLEIDKVQEIIQIKEILMIKLLTMMPKIDFTKLLNDTDGLHNLSTTLLNFNVTENVFKFSYSRQTEFPSSKVNLNLNQKEGPAQTLDMSENEQYDFNIKGLLYPVFISVFLALDALLLWYRFSWLIKNRQVLKNGLEKKTPYDCITRKAHFILTGTVVQSSEESFDIPQEYFWGKSSLCDNSTPYGNYLQYMNADQKTRADYFKEITGKFKATDAPKKNKSLWKKSLILAYRLFIAPLFWRLVLILGFVLLLCLVAMATNDLVTVESAMFLLDTDAMVPLLERQSYVTNTALSHYVAWLNTFLEVYKEAFDKQIQTLNILMEQLAETQTNLLNDVISNMCNLARIHNCNNNIDLVAMSLTSCNFLPIHMKPFTGFRESILQQYIQAELTPLVLNIRSIIFSTVNLLLTYAGIMIICQILARVIFVYLKNSQHLKMTKIYQLSSILEEPYNDQQSNPKDDNFATESLIAESCESGVYID